MSDRTIESPWRVDDMRDDVAAAYKDVVGRMTSDDDAGHDEGTPAPESNEQDAAESTERARDPVTKRFVKGTPPAKTEPVHQTADQQQKPVTKEASKQPGAEDNQADPKASQQPEAVTKSAPPPSFSVQTKAAWEKLPQHVRDDIVKREGEMQTGLAALRDYKDLKPYADLAGQKGTTIKAALDGYISIENLLRKDVGAGMAQIAQNFGLNQEQAAQLFASLAQKFGGGAVPGTPKGGNEQAETDPLAEIMKPILAPLMTQIGDLRNEYQTRVSAERSSKTQNEIEALIASDPTFYKFHSDLEESMAQLIESGFVKRTGDTAVDFKAAYEMAARMNSAVHEALIEQRLTEQRDSERKVEQDKVAKAKAASRSISGSRIPGTVVQQAENDDTEDDLEATVRKAFRLHSNG